MMNRYILVPVSIILIMLLLFCCPVLAAYQQPYYSHAYANLSASAKSEYEASMKAGDAYNQKGDYLNAARAYNNAWQITGGNDYVSLAAVGQVEVAMNKDKPSELARARHFLYAAAQQLQDENPGGYEQYDLMAKIRTSQAEMHRLMGNEEAARISEKEAADYRNKANAADDKPGLPLSPLIPLVGLITAAAIVLFCDRKRSG
jgi:hypothetical protein